MKMTDCKKHLSLLLCVVLIAAMALFATGCGDNTDTPFTDNSQAVTTTAANAEATVLGKGEKQFDFIAADIDGNEAHFEIHTDKNTVGEALLELELIDGDKGDFGLYVKTVNGITADYNTNGTYWAFYIGGEYAMTGVDTTEIEEGTTYSFKVEK